MPDDGIPWDMPLASSAEGLILEATRNRLRGLGLPGIQQERIVIQSLAWMPDPVEFPPPYVIISPAPETTPWQEGTNERDVAYFAAVISVVLANARDLTRGMGLQLYWRERIRRKFQCKSIATFTELTFTDNTQLIQTIIESGDKFIEAAKRDQRDAQYYVVRFKVREPRD